MAVFGVTLAIVFIGIAALTVANEALRIRALALAPVNRQKTVRSHEAESF